MAGNRRQSHSFLDYPKTHYPRLNSVNGLLLLQKVNTSHADLHKTDLMLWNPILGKTHKLPTLGFPSSTLGFGFSPSENDHKVIAITKRPSLSVHLYKLSTGTWSSIVDYQVNAVQGTDSRGVLIKGEIFWASGYATTSLLISFDVKNEVFDYITVPTDATCRRVDPVAYRKWVGLLDYDGFENYSCSLWVLNEDDDKMARSWSKLYTVVLDEFHMPDYLCWRRSGQIIFATREEGVKMADMEAQTVKHLLKGRPFVYHKRSIALTYCTSFKESLMLL